MHHRAALEGQERFGAPIRSLWPAITAVLLYGRLNGLGEVGLELHRGHRQAIDEEHQVNLIRLVQRIAQLRHHTQTVGGVTRGHRVITGVFR